MTGRAAPVDMFDWDWAVRQRIARIARAADPRVIAEMVLEVAAEGRLPRSQLDAVLDRYTRAFCP